MNNACLILSDGSEFFGKSFGYPHSSAGEVVFNTAMTGYPESLSDPSYTGQILVSTYPLVGNYGVPENIMEDGISRLFESDGVKVKGLVISEYSEAYNHWNAKYSLGDWLNAYKVPGIAGIDTRALTRHIREYGSVTGKIVVKGEDIPFYDPGLEILQPYVSVERKTETGNGKYRILLVDCGVKHNIIRCLLNRDCTVVRVPWDYDFSHEAYDGILVSNGPGDPALCVKTIEHLRNALKGSSPVFGICLGSQLMALASGAKTYKMKYGHRSHNQPVLLKGTERCFISSQNHGYAVDNSTISNDWEPMFINVNDGTNEGIRHTRKPFFSVQFHPEASSGPTDTEFLFDNFIKLIDHSYIPKI